ncbi:MAG: PEP-CTERM sorting domain-containing protein, partial [Planctomycetota bacterium]|nr:PEP-CTERM sorting domain-containing protein [Planctomycetota bacterium]
IMAGSSPAGPIGSFGVSAVGDINLGTDTYSALDRFDTAGNLFPPPSGSLNGVEAGIVGPSVDLTADGFTSQGPVVQGWDGVNTTLPGQMVFTFNITAGTLTTDEILNVQPLFGTDGAPLIPEPSTIALFALGLGGLGLVRRRKK